MLLNSIFPSCLEALNLIHQRAAKIIVSGLNPVFINRNPIGRDKEPDIFLIITKQADIGLSPGGFFFVLSNK